MSSSVAPKIIPAALPDELAIFPLVGTVLLPQGRLPLNIFEPRYLAMIDDALGRGRLIGMIQPNAADDITAPPLFSVGCAGRVTSFNETDDGRYLIVLTGVCRFRVVAETPTSRLYRTVKADWKPYLADLTVPDDAEINRAHLINLLQIYFKKNNISVDWNVVENAPDDVLISTIIMICPLAANEKQALLEAETFVQRVALLEALLEMAIMPQADSENEIRH